MKQIRELQPGEVYFASGGFDFEPMIRFGIFLKYEDAAKLAQEASKDIQWGSVEIIKIGEEATPIPVAYWEEGKEIR